MIKDRNEKLIKVGKSISKHVMDEMKREFGEPETNEEKKDFMISYTSLACDFCAASLSRLAIVDHDGDMDEAKKNIERHIGVTQAAAFLHLEEEKKSYLMIKEFFTNTTGTLNA